MDICGLLAYQQVDRVVMWRAAIFYPGSLLLSEISTAFNAVARKGSAFGVAAQIARLARYSVRSILICYGYIQTYYVPGTSIRYVKCSFWP
jgi:hypothetical protein